MSTPRSLLISTTAAALTLLLVAMSTVPAAYGIAPFATILGG